MLDCKVIELSDKPWIDKLLAMSDFMGCEYCFANNYAWRKLYKTQISRYKDFYVSCSYKYGMRFTFPAGQGDYKDLFIQLKKCAEEKNSPLIVTSVTNDKLELFNELFPGQFTVENDDSYNDYIYNASDLRDLKGKKYHQKRNHLKKFYENNWQFSLMTEKDYDDCIEFAVKSYNQNNAYDDESSVSEQFAINTFFSSFEQLNLKGGVIRIDGKVVAFTIGEGINSNTFCIHIEKADTSYQGSYPAINNEFAKAATDGYKYINREEDLGIEGLRRSKRSYYPAFMLVKNTVIFK
jgi:hypothetical protein